MKFKYVSQKKYNYFVFGNDNKDFFKSSLDDYFMYEISDKVIFINLKIFIIFIFYLSIYYSIKKAYLISLILSKTKKNVLTLEDNNVNFSFCVKALESRFRFIAFQNGVRYDLKNLTDKNLLKNYYFSEYAGFGKYEKQLFKELKIHVEKYHCIGSLSAKKAYSEFKSAAKENLNKYDICIISECFDGYEILYPGIDQCIGKILKYTKKFASKENLKVCIAMKYNKDVKMIKTGRLEKDYINDFINTDGIDLIYRDENKYNSYFASFRSLVTIGMVSSLLIETLALRNKIMICDYFGNPWTLGHVSDFVLSEKNYESFESKISFLLSLSSSQYLEKFSSSINYLSSPNYDTVEQSVHKVVNWPLSV